MKTKVYISDESGHFLKRVIKTEEGKEYILHKGMKAFLETFSEKEYGDYLVIQKRISYYIEK